MSSRIFSRTYSAVLQTKVEEQIASGDLEKALKTLESFPNASTSSEKLERLIVLYEGYKTVAKEYGGSTTERYKDLEGNDRATREKDLSEEEKVMSILTDI